MTQLIRHIPAVHTVQQSSTYIRLKDEKEIPEQVLKEWAQAEIETIRKQLLKDSKTEFTSKEEILQFILDRLEERASFFSKYKLRRVINGTGTVLHTNLGRARLSELALQRVVETSSHYSTLEYNVEEGKRGSRHNIIQDLLVKATNSEAAMVVNNNAAAVYLILRALGKDKEVVVSRGELVEIGGSFRVSTIMEESDAKLVEVGTTNKTHPYDYEDAITENTSMLMKVHTSNFKTVGFTAEVTTEELKKIANEKSEQLQLEKRIIVYEDLGSGSLYPFRHDGIGEEPVVKEALKHADLVSFSGDKLLGGPQAGIIAGKKELIDKLKKHPLARVLRVDKMTLAALEATLYQYVYEKDVTHNNPTLRDVLQSAEDIRERVVEFLEAISFLQQWNFEIAEDASQVGGGTMPTVARPTVGLIVTHPQLTPTKIEKKLREMSIPLITRIKAGQVFIDFRTISKEEIPLLVENFKKMELHETN